MPQGTRSTGCPSLPALLCRLRTSTADVAGRRFPISRKAAGTSQWREPADCSRGPRPMLVLPTRRALSDWHRDGRWHPGPATRSLSALRLVPEHAPGALRPGLRTGGSGAHAPVTRRHMHCQLRLAAVYTAARRTVVDTTRTLKLGSRTSLQVPYRRYQVTLHCRSRGDAAARRRC